MPFHISQLANSQEERLEEKFTIKLAKCLKIQKTYTHQGKACLHARLNSGVTKLLLMPGQRPGKPPTHVHTHRHWYSVQNMLYLLFCVQDISILAQSSGVQTIQTDTGSSCALISD